MKDFEIIPGLETTYGGGAVGHTQAYIHQSKKVFSVGALAMQLTERWGMVTAVPDGEDSAGRQKHKLLTPRELALRACDCAAELFKEIESRGWVFDVPPPSPVERHK
jgi:hypothetical protein